MKEIARRTALVGLGAAAGWGLASVMRPSLPVYTGTRRLIQTTGATVLNDASGLSATPVNKHIMLKQDAGDELIKLIRAELKLAASEGRRLNVGAARHSITDP